MKLLLLFLTLLISSINCNAFMRKVVGDKLDEKDRSAVNLNFQELEQRLSNKVDGRTPNTTTTQLIAVWTLLNSN